MGHVTCLFEHFVALIQHEDLQVGQIKGLVLDEGQDSARSTHDHMGWLQSFQQLNVLIDGLSTVDHFSSDLRKMLGESSELFLDLISKLSSMAQYQCRHWFRVLRQLMENSENENSCLTHTRLSLAQHINTNHGIRNALLLNFRGMFKSAIDDCSLQLGLKQKVLKACRVDTSVSG